MSFIVLHKGILIHSGNNFRTTHTKTPKYSHFRMCRFGMLFPLSFESNSLTDYLDYGTSALVMKKESTLKGLLFTTHNRIVEIIAVREADGEYDTMATIMKYDDSITYYLGMDYGIMARLAIAVQEPNVYGAVDKVMRATFEARYKKPEPMNIEKIVNSITTDRKNKFELPFQHFRNPDFVLPPSEKK